MLAVSAYYVGIVLSAFATYYAHNYPGIIGSTYSQSIVHVNSNPID